MTDTWSEWNALRHELSEGNTRQEFVVNKMERVIEKAIAHIAELTAQAALDSPVAEAAKRLGSENIYRLARLSVSSEREISALADATYTAEGKGIKGAALALDAALAARKEE